MLVKMFGPGMSKDLGDAVIAGFSAHGHRVFAAGLADDTDCDAAVMYGFREPKPQIAERLAAKGIPVLVIEDGHLRPPLIGERQYQLALGGINMLPAGPCPSDRFEALGLERAAEKKDGGDYILVCGQIPGDAQHPMTRRAEMIDWIYMTLGLCKKNSDLPIRYRPHPRLFISYAQSPLLTPWGADECSRSDEVILAEDLAGAHALVTYNSGAGHEALLRGVPVFCDSSAIYAPWANTDITELAEPEFTDTEDYFNRVGYAQWSMSEIADGTALEFELGETRNKSKSGGRGRSTGSKSKKKTEVKADDKKEG
jgi:hypothetical protein